MTRRGLIPTTVLTLLLTGLVLSKTGWLGTRALGSTAARTGEAPRLARATDALDSKSVWRWRSAQPHHWRACILQR